MDFKKLITFLLVAMLFMAVGGYSVFAAVVNPVSPGDGFWTSNQTPVFIFNFTDPNNATMSCELEIGGTGYDINASALNNTPTTLVANASVPEGTYNWLVNCSLGNNSNVSSARNINIDVNAPNVGISSPAPNAWTNDNTTDITFNFTDSMSPNASCTVWVNGIMYGTNGGVLNNTPTVITVNDSGLSDGTGYSLSVNCTDLVGNEGGSGAQTLNVDTVAATVNMLTTSFSTGVNTPSVTFNYSDSLAGTANCTLYFDGSSAANNVSTLNWTSTVLTSAAQGDGVYDVYVNCSDQANNIGKSGNITVTIDTNGPTVNINASLDDTQINSNNTNLVDFNFADGGSSTASCTLYFNSTSYGSNSSVLNNTQTAITVDDTMSSGRYDVWVNCTDGLSNEDKSAVINISYICYEDWSCNAWSTCTDGLRTRMCTDANSCGTTTNRPSLSGSCTSSGGGGGGAPPTPALSKMPAKASLKRYGVHYFMVRGDRYSHKVRIQEIRTNGVWFIFNSEQIEVFLEQGETKKVDVTGDNKADVVVTLLSFTTNDAEINLAQAEGEPIEDEPVGEPVEEVAAEEEVMAEEPVQEVVEEKPEKKEVAEEPVEEEVEKKSNPVAIVLLVIAAIILVVLIIGFAMKKKPKAVHHHEHKKHEE